MKKVRIVNKENTMYVGSQFNKCETYNIIQRDDCIELVFKNDGVFRIYNKRILLTGFYGAYNFTYDTTSSGNNGIVTDIGVNTIKVMGKKKKEMNILKVFPAIIPTWEKSISKTYTYGFKNDTPNRVIEYFTVGDFEMLVVYNSEDAFLPEYEALTDYFGKKFQYLGTSIRFRPGNTSIREISNRILKDDKSEYVAYTTTTDDLIITKERNENRIFRTLELPQDKEAEDIRDVTDDRERRILEVLEQAAKAVSASNNNAEDYKSLVSAIEAITQRLAVIEQLLVADRNPNKRTNEIKVAGADDILNDIKNHKNDDK